VYISLLSEEASGNHFKKESDSGSALMSYSTRDPKVKRLKKKAAKRKIWRKNSAAFAKMKANCCAATLVPLFTTESSGEGNSEREVDLSAL